MVQGANLRLPPIIGKLFDKKLLPSPPTAGGGLGTTTRDHISEGVGLLSDDDNVQAHGSGSR